VGFFSSRAAKIALALVGVGVLAFGYFHRAAAGVKELDLALPLVADARSWHLIHTAGAVKVEEDVVCPFDYDATTTIGQLSTREVQVNHMYYDRNSAGQWNSRAGGEFGHCSGGPQINHMGLALNLRTIRERGVISRGGTKDVGGRTCRDWNLGAPGISQTVATLCIDEENHYPLELASAQETYQFSNWNGVAAIEPPQIDTVATPSTASDQVSDASTIQPAPQ